MKEIRVERKQNNYLTRSLASPSLIISLAEEKTRAAHSEAVYTKALLTLLNDDHRRLTARVSDPPERIRPAN
ncbi:hypothetical protein AOLI_G00203660 [Acnodon oligacanthus]